MKEAKMFKGVSIFDFSNHFTSNEDCKDYLSEIKWSSGYNCRKCSHAKYGSSY